MIPFSMLCPGISQNTKHHHLNLYKGQVWGEKSYAELCDNNVLNVLYSSRSMRSEDIIEQNDELYVPPVPGIGFINDDFTQIPWNSEILQSFAELTHITHISFLYFDPDVQSIASPQFSYEQGLNKDPIPAYEIHIGSFKWKLGEFCGCGSQTDSLSNRCLRCRTAHKHQCVTPHSHKTWYIWTKEGFKTQKANLSF